MTELSLMPHAPVAETTAPARDTSGSDRVMRRLMGLHPKMIDLTLDRTHRLLAALGHPERHLPPVIHVAGTNGKGSTQAMIRAGLETGTPMTGGRNGEDQNARTSDAGGGRVHAYTSPHLAWFHERIRLAGTLITEEALSAVLEECEAVNAGAGVTFFEITTCAAFLAFSRTPADWLLLEVGLGGRMDSTNVIDHPRLTVITPVSIDHQQYLGETLAEIAFEKAGILKRGVTCIVGPQHPDGLAVIERQAARIGAPLMVHGQHWHCAAEGGRLIFQDETGLLDLPMPNLRGPHQIDNAGAAIAALRALGQDSAACEAAVTRAYWPARMQRLRSGPLVSAAPRAELWLDGGHNPAGGQAVAATLAEMTRHPTHLVVGMLNTKDIAGYLRPLAAHAQTLTAVSIPGTEATLSADATAAAAKAAGINATTASSVQAAVETIVTADPTARILICGSLYLAGHVLRENG